MPQCTFINIYVVYLVMYDFHMIFWFDVHNWNRCNWNWPILQLYCLLNRNFFLAYNSFITCHPCLIHTGITVPFFFQKCLLEPLTFPPFKYRGHPIFIQKILTCRNQTYLNSYPPLSWNLDFMNCDLNNKNIGHHVLEIH